MPDRALIEQLDQSIERMRAGAKQTGADDPTLSALMEIADTLRELPDDRFKTRLSRELQAEFERRPPMTRSTPIETTESAGGEFTAIHTITPFICVPEGGKLIEFMKHTFGAEETGRHPHGPDGFVAGVRIGDSDLLIMGGESFPGQESHAALHVNVTDCEATYQRALDAGAFPLGSVGEPADRPYGERAAFVSDPFGNYSGGSHCEKAPGDSRRCFSLSLDPTRVGCARSDYAQEQDRHGLREDRAGRIHDGRPPCCARGRLGPTGRVPARVRPIQLLRTHPKSQRYRIPPRSRACRTNAMSKANAA